MTDVEGQRAGDGPVTPASWAPPESGVVGPAHRGAGPMADDLLGGPARPVADPPPAPVALRPLGGSGIFDGAFEVLKVRPKVLLGAAAMVVVPIQGVVFLLRGGPYRLDGLSALTAVSDGDPAAARLWDGSTLGAWLGGGLEMVATFVVGLVVARVVAAWYAGADPGPWAALRDGVRRPLPAIGAFSGMVLAQALGSLVLCVGVLVPMAWFSVLAPVLGVERLGLVGALRRSIRLVNRRFVAVVGLVLGMALIDQLVHLALVALPSLLADGLPGAAATGVRVTAGCGASVISSVFIATACTLVYFDLRVRSEGLDIELEATDAFASPT